MILQTVGVSIDRKNANCFSDTMVFPAFFGFFLASVLTSVLAGSSAASPEDNCLNGSLRLGPAVYVSFAVCCITTTREFILHRDGFAVRGFNRTLAGLVRSDAQATNIIQGAVNEAHSLFAVRDRGHRLNRVRRKRRRSWRAAGLYAVAAASGRHLDRILFRHQRRLRRRRVSISGHGRRRRRHRPAEFERLLRWRPSRLQLA